MGGQGGGGEHVVPGECATTSQSHSFTCSRASSLESTPFIFPTPLMCETLALIPFFLLLKKGLIVALTTDLGSDYYVACVIKEELTL